MGQCKIPSKKVKVNGRSSAMREVVKAIKKTRNRGKQGKLIAAHSLHIIPDSQTKELQKRCLKYGKSYCQMHARAVRITGFARVSAKTAIERTKRADCSKLTQREFWKAVAKARRRMYTLLKKSTTAKRGTQVSQR